MNNAYAFPFARGRGSEARPTRLLATLPAFTYTPSQYQTATILAEYPLTNTGKISIGRMPDEIADNDTFILAVRYLDSNGDVIRYVLHHPAGINILYPSYDGQTLEASAVLEVWANTQEVSAVLAAAAQIPINTLTYAADFTNCYCLRITQNTMTLVAATFDAVETGPCNPFCDCTYLVGGGVPDLPGGQSTCLPILRGYGSPEGVVVGLKDQWYWDYTIENFYWHESAVTGTTGWIIID